MRPFGRAAAGATARLATRRGRAAGVLDVSERGRSMTPRIVVMAESAIDGVTLSERFDASDLDSEYLRARLFEPPVVGGWRCPSGRASWRRGVRCRRAQSRGRYEAIQPGRSRDGPVDDLRDRVEMIQKTQGALGRRGWREPPVEGRGAGFPSRGPQLACRRQPRRSQSWHCDHADSAGRMTARRRLRSLRVWGAGMIAFVRSDRPAAAPALLLLGERDRGNRGGRILRVGMLELLPGWPQRRRRRGVDA